MNDGSFLLMLKTVWDMVKVRSSMKRLILKKMKKLKNEAGNRNSSFRSCQRSDGVNTEVYRKNYYGSAKR